MDLSFGAGEIVRAQQLQALGDDRILSLTPAQTYTTTTSTWADITPLTALSLVKQFDSTRLKFDVHVSSWVLGAVATVAEFTINIQNTFNPFDLAYQNVASAHAQWSSIAVTDGFAFPAGEYTATLGWARYSGTGTVILDAFDRITFAVAEIKG